MPQAETSAMTSKPNSQPQAPASRDEPNPPASEDSVPQDDGTDNSWQMEPLEEMRREDEEAGK